VASINIEPTATNIVLLFNAPMSARQTFWHGMALLGAQTNLLDLSCSTLWMTYAMAITLMISTIALARFFCLLDSGSWMPFCSEMCVHLDTKRRGVVHSYLLFMPFREAFGIPFLSSFWIRCTSFGKGQLRSALRVKLHGDLLFRS
jgi:hypothetical protein